MARKTPTLNAADRAALDDIRVFDGKRRRPLTKSETETLLQIYAIKGDFDISVDDLAPPGTILARAVRHFVPTDISLIMPIMQVVMLAAAHLTQIGAYLDVPGVGRIRPTQWNVVLASSGSSKTLAKDEIFRSFAKTEGVPPVAMMPAAGSDAQWIEGMREHNGTYWLQDEVGKYFNKVLRDALFRRMKPWLLDAYSHQQIDNILKTAEDKTVIPDPHFAFLGLGVADTWTNEIDAASMLDGYCQRFNYVLAEPRVDTDVFDHFLYFQGPKVEADRARLRKNWEALCAQPGAAGPYRLNDDVLPFLAAWWRGLRASWGNTPVPASFIRRIGFSILRYLPVLHFLLGKSRWAIDVETAELATRYAELHFQSILKIMQQYDPRTAGSVGLIVAKRQDLLSNGKPATKREIMRKLSKSQREAMDRGMINAVLAVLEKIEEMPGLVDGAASPKEKSAAIVGRRDEILARSKHNQRKRNERRTRILVNKLNVSRQPNTDDDADPTSAAASCSRGAVANGAYPPHDAANDDSSIIDDLFDFTGSVVDRSPSGQRGDTQVVRFPWSGKADPR